MRLTILLGTSTSIGALAIALLPAPAHGGPDCNSCKPSSATWDWKANGYQLGSDAETAKKAALEAGTQSACDKAAPFLAKNPVKCKAGCDGGDVTQTCKPREEPKCTHGTYDSDKGMWTFICRKTRQGHKDAPACDEARATAMPGWGMCDVKVRSLKERDCAAPGCG
jgi:hypothetical protein